MLTTSHITSRVHQHHRCCLSLVVVVAVVVICELMVQSSFPSWLDEKSSNRASQLLRLRASLRLLLLLARDRVGGVLGGIYHNVHDRDRDIQPLEPTMPT